MHRKLILISLLLISGLSQANEESFFMPNQFVFGSSLDKIQSNLEALCYSLQIKEITPITAPLAEVSQHQINCSGFVYGGKERDIELVFQDDQLDIVWILFQEEEKQKIISSFKIIHGEPTMDVAFGTIFLQANAAIRNTPSEVLFASNRQVKVMLQKLKQQQESRSKQEN